MPATQVPKDINDTQTNLTEGAIYPEPCPSPIEISVDGCKDFAIADLPAVSLYSLGRIVRVNLTLKSICPNKRVAVSVILSEVDDAKTRYARGVKHFVIPAQGGDVCKDLIIKCIDFSMPEELKPSGDSSSICAKRTFGAQVIANYIDTDYTCCN